MQPKTERTIYKIALWSIATVVVVGGVSITAFGIWFNRYVHEASASGMLTRYVELDDREALLEGLELGANPNGRYEEPYTSVDLAAKLGKLDFLELLLQHGGDPNNDSVEGRTPLHFAAMGGSLEAAKLLLEHGADPHITDDHGHVPAHYAIEAGHDELYEFLNDQPKQK